MTAATRIPEFINDDPDDDIEDSPPLPFKVTYTRRGTDGKAARRTDQFTAIPKTQVPYVWVLDYFASGLGDHSAQAAATIQFLDRVLVDEDKPRFAALIRDPKVALRGKTLRDVQIYLLSEYESPDPTPARSAGPKSSQASRRSTGRGSSSSPKKKATTSR